jgi:hypothetical protein
VFRSFSKDWSHFVFIDTIKKWRNIAISQNKKEVPMKNVLAFLLIVILTSGCSGAFWGGVGGGALGGAAGYEVNLERQMRKIDSDLADGTIDQKEYEIRKSQIERDSLIK